MNDNSNQHSDVDARIDALARAAGSELRRPAPATGLASLRAARRRRQLVGAAAGGAAVVLLAVGAFVFLRDDDGARIVPADTTVATTVETSPNGAGDPDVIYATTGLMASPDYVQQVIDPATGAVVSSEAVDFAAAQVSRDAQDALTAAAVVDGLLDQPVHPGVIGYRFDVGDVAYGYEVRGSDSPELPDEDPAVLALFDRCGQSELTVEGASSSALPARAYYAALSLDRNWIVTVSSDCPADGTLVGQTSILLDAPKTIEVFDAQRPDQPGRVLASGVTDVGSLFFSADSRYLAAEGGPGYRVFDLADGSNVEIVPPGACTMQGGRYARFSGPWVGESTLVLALTCGSDAPQLLVKDVRTGNSFGGSAPESTAGDYLVVEVDAAHYDLLDNAWFTMCVMSPSAQATTCWYGELGTTGQRIIPGAQEASFLPLGFSYGG